MAAWARWWLLAALVVSCASPLQPPPPRTASASAGGVEVTVTTGAWRGWPPDLGNLVSPMHVRIVNGGNAALRVTPSAFSLTLSDGRRLAAAPPDEVRAVVAEPPPAPTLDAGLALGPLRERSGPGWAVNEAAPEPRPDPTHDPDRTWLLPSPDMLALALPDESLAPGATASGFLYFERPPRGTSPTDLAARLVDAASGESLGTVLVPLARP